MRKMKGQKSKGTYTKFNNKCQNPDVISLEPYDAW